MFRSRTTLQLYYFNPRTGDSQFDYPQALPTSENPQEVTERPRLRPPAGPPPQHMMQSHQQDDWLLERPLTRQEVHNREAGDMQWGTFPPFCLKGCRNEGLNGVYNPRFEWTHHGVGSDGLTYPAVIRVNNANIENPILVYAQFYQQHWAVTPRFFGEGAERCDMLKEIMAGRCLGQNAVGLAFFSHNNQMWYETNPSNGWLQEAPLMKYSQNPADFDVETGSLQVPSHGLPLLRTPPPGGFSTPGLRVPGLYTPSGQSSRIRAAEPALHSGRNLPSTPGSPQLLSSPPKRRQEEVFSVHDDSIEAEMRRRAAQPLAEEKEPGTPEIHSPFSPDAYIKMEPGPEVEEGDSSFLRDPEEFERQEEMEQNFQAPMTYTAPATQDWDEGAAGGEWEAGPAGGESTSWDAAGADDWSAPATTQEAGGGNW